MLLDASEINELVILACESRLSEPGRRRLLMAGVSDLVVESFPVLDTPRDQVRSDLLEMNSRMADVPADGHPLVIWLANAASLADSHETIERLRTLGLAVQEALEQPKGPPFRLPFFSPGTRVVWHSTPETFARGDISCLAILETVLACIIATELIRSTDLRYILAFQVSIAPLLLLRTRRSVGGGLETLRRCSWWRLLGAEGPAKLLLVCTIVAFFMGLPFFGLLLTDLRRKTPGGGPTTSEMLDAFIPILTTCTVFLGGFVLVPLVRVWAAVKGFVVQPVEAAMTIPQNWFRHVFCMDMAHTPEPVPGYAIASMQGSVDGELLPENAYHYLGTAYMGSIWSRTEGTVLHHIVGLALSITATAFAVMVYIPALVARWSMKFTCTVWLPILFLVKGALHPSYTLPTRLALISNSVVGKLAVTYAFGLFALCVATWSDVLTFSSDFSTLAHDQVLQVLAIVIGIAGVSRYLLADWAIRVRKDASGAFDMVSAEKTIRALEAALALCSICGVVRAVHLV